MPRKIKTFQSLYGKPFVKINGDEIMVKIRAGKYQPFWIEQYATPLKFISALNDLLEKTWFTKDHARQLIDVVLQLGLYKKGQWIPAPDDHSP